MLTDNGPLVALINRNDPHHERYKAAVRQWPAAPLLTTWPCWTEAMYLLYRAGGYAQDLQPAIRCGFTTPGRKASAPFIGESLPFVCLPDDRGSLFGVRGAYKFKWS